MNDDTSKLWDRAADTFDSAADHGLRDPDTRAAWQRLLLPLIGDRPRTIADLGCGTGSLSIMLAQAGHRVHAVDFSSEMLRIARQKAATVTPAPQFTHGDAAAPGLPTGAFDVVLSRHVLWALPDQPTAVHNWVRLLRPSGQLILIEGNWSTGAGLAATACADLLRPYYDDVHHHPLEDPALWGGPISDERYLMIGAAEVA